jgi:serine phosphatase RsbU (regulator of sigma subunit)
MAKDSESVKKIRISIRIKLSVAMILTTAVTIAVMASYFINRQSEMLLKSTMTSAERETEHLAVTTREAISTNDELSLLSAIDNAKKLESVQYCHVLDPSGIVLQSSDTTLIGRPLFDDITRNALNHKGIDSEPKILSQKSADSKEMNLSVYDFSAPVYDKLTGKKRIATVRFGLSDALIKSEIRKLTKILALITLGFIIGAGIVALIFASLTTRSVKVLSNGVNMIGQGNLDYKISVNSRDEIGMLADQFNTMTSQLKEAQSREIENRIMEEQLDLAKEIQEGLNPMSFYNKNGIEMKGYTRAAKGVGGDYFDYNDIDENRVGALISDVSGKGVPASLVMVMIRTVFVTALRQDARKIQCSKVVSAINGSLSADFAIDKFATLFFLIYDRERQTVSFSNAGHGPLFCYRASLNRCTVTKLDGMPIGVMEESEYRQGEVPFGVGDIIVLNTDGVTEMRNEQKEEYGRTKVQQFLLKNHSLNAQEIVNGLVADVDKFQGEAPQHDDMTLLVMKRTG